MDLSPFNIFLDLWFMVTWTETDESGDQLTDILPAKKLVGDADSVEPGSIQEFIFDGDGNTYEGEVKAQG